jgi:hypothetical protein
MHERTRAAPETSGAYTRFIASHANSVCSTLNMCLG